MDGLHGIGRRHGARSARLGRAAAAAGIAAGLLVLGLASGPAAAVSYGTAPPAASAAPSATASAAPAVASATPSPTAAASPSVPASLALGSHATSFGTVLTGPNGLTLYTLSSDPSGGSICTGQCLTFWPPLFVAPGGAVTGPSGTTGTFATFVRSDDGMTQVTLDGRALYYFKNDSQAGEANGEGIQALGGVWHVMKVASATASATSAATSAGAAAATASPQVTIPPTSTSDPASPAGDQPVLLAILFLVSLAAASLRFATARVRD